MWGTCSSCTHGIGSNEVPAELFVSFFDHEHLLIVQTYTVLLRSAPYFKRMTSSRDSQVKEIRDDLGSMVRQTELPSISHLIKRMKEGRDTPLSYGYPLTYTTPNTDRLDAVETVT